MPKYECLNCHRVFYGWRVKSKYKGKCPDCGGKLQKVSNNKESRKVEGYYKEDSEISLSRLLRLDI